ncbi:MAG: RNA polymerase sigma factor [Caldilineaceae bacterium]
MSSQSLQTLTDQELLRAVKQNGDAFSVLYQRHVAHVYRYLLFRVGNVQDAQDLTAQTFVTALEKAGNYRGEGTVGAWFLGIARHKLADHYRQQRVHAPLELALELPDAGALVEDWVATQLQHEQIAQALRMLPAERAEALALRFFAGLNTSETAQAMARSEAAVKMLVHRGVQDLRRLLLAQVEVQP